MEEAEKTATWTEASVDWVRSSDMFGHSIALNFERNGDTYNTITGGIVSIMCKLFLTFYVGSCFYKMIWHQADTTITNIGS